MKRNYVMIKLNNEPHDFLVIATSSISPLACLNDIEKEINSKQANVLFDLTLINGTNSNRYLEGVYIEKRFDIKSFRKIKNVNANIRKISYDFFENNKEILDNSVIPRAAKFLLLEKKL